MSSENISSENIRYGDWQCRQIALRKKKEEETKTLPCPPKLNHFPRHSPYDDGAATVGNKSLARSP